MFTGDQDWRRFVGRIAAKDKFLPGDALEQAATYLYGDLERLRRIRGQYPSHVAFVQELNQVVPDLLRRKMLRDQVIAAEAEG